MNQTEVEVDARAPLKTTAFKIDLIGVTQFDIFRFFISWPNFLDPSVDGQ